MTSKTEPAVLRGVIIAILALLATAGVSWAADPSKGTIAALVTVASFVVPIVQALWTRFAVTPNAQVIAQKKPTGAVVAGDAAAVESGAPVAVEVRPAA